MYRIGFGFFIAAILGGCTIADFTKTGMYKASTKNIECEIIVFTTQPKVEFEEIGVMEYGGFTGGATSITMAKESAAEEICKNGGNGLLLWEANGLGKYTKGTVIYLKK